MKYVSSILMTSALLSLVACGNEQKKSSHPRSQSFLLSEAGQYEATLSPMNEHLAGAVEGKARVRIKGDDITFEVKVHGTRGSTRHAQYIHVAESCPTLASDENKDGVIDAQEGMKSFGPAVIPLDTMLRTQIEGDSTFPASDFSGDYYYRQNVTMTELMFDLTAKDPDPQDHMIKLRSTLGLAGRQVVIYGVADDADIPESVRAFHGKTKQASLPIACGSFVKIAADDEGSSSNGGKD